MPLRRLLHALIFCTAAAAFGSPFVRADDAPAARDVAQLEAAAIPWRASLVPPSLRDSTVLRLAVVPVAFPDRRPHAHATQAYWQALFFDRHDDAFAGSASGSVADYYGELSYGSLAVQGRVFEPVAIATTAEALLAMPMVNTGGLYREKALEALRASGGADVLDGFDALCFIGAGDAGRRGRGLWPHRGKIEGLPYIQLTEGYRKEMPLAVGIPCHEFGHLFGFKDKYGLRNPRQGPGPWCLMGRGTHGGTPSGRARPFSMCAWCRTQIGWLEPVTIDPRTPQRVRLQPVSAGKRQAVRIAMKEDGSEYYLLEVRAKRGLERDLPDEGLLIWHVGERRNVENFPVREYDVVLEPPHTRRVVDAPTRYAAWACWPKPGQSHFTPDTSPSSRTRTPGTWPVHIRNITRHADGAVTFDVGPGATPGDRSLPAPEPAARTLLAVLLLEEGAEAPAPGTEREVRREIDRLLFSQGDYFGARRSLHGRDVQGSLRDYVEESSGLHATLRGRRLAGTRGLWRVVPKGALADPARALASVLPEDHGADAIVAFLALPPPPREGPARASRFAAGRLAAGTPFCAVRCGDGFFGSVGPLARWWLREQYGDHVDGSGGPGCLLTGGTPGAGQEDAATDPAAPCAACALRWGWIARRAQDPAALRPRDLFAEAWVKPDGTLIAQRRATTAPPRAEHDALVRHDRVVPWVYPSCEDLAAALAALEAFPGVAVSTPARSLQGRPVHLVRVAGAGPLPPDERPALFVTAALHGNEASTVPAVLSWLERLARGGGPRDVTVYAMPCVNADAYAAFVRKPHTTWRPRANYRAFDDDGDGREDEDGYSDLDGDGEIGQMRRKKADGGWEMLGREGLDDDGDGRFSEDIPGGVDLNRNFPEGWRGGRGPFKLSRGAAPLSEPESRAVADALRAHPNVALVIDVHNDADTLFVRMGPQAARGRDLKDHADWASYAPVITAARATFAYEPRRMGRAGIFASWAYEALGIPAALLEIGNGAATRAPATQDPAKANAWSQEAFGVDGWNRWAPFQHPQLGAIEIGGDWKRFVKRSPPPGLALGTVCARTSHFLDQCLTALPRTAARIVRTDEGGFALLLHNPGAMPACSARLADVAPGRARLHLTLRPGSVLARPPDGWTLLARNARETVVVRAPLGAGEHVSLPLHGVAAAEAVTAVVAGAWPGGGARVFFKPDTSDAGEVLQVAMPKHRSHYVLHVPASLERAKPAALLVDLHGAAPVARNPAKISVAPWKPLVAKHGFLHLLPQSRARAWGITEGDAQFISDCIGKVVKEYRVDPKRIWITGFSSGADYLPRFLLAYPKAFAAAAPMFPGSFPYRRGTGGLTPDTLKTIARVPLLYVTGSEDVRNRTVREIVYTFRSLELDAHMRVVPDVGHVFPPTEEYVRILRFFEGARPAGDPLPALEFERRKVKDGHVVLPPVASEDLPVLVVLAGRGAAETRPELRAYEAVHALADRYRVVLPWRASGVDGAFLVACLKRARVRGPFLLYAHAGAADRVAGLLDHGRIEGVVVSGPRAGLRKALEAAAPSKRLHVLIGARAFDRKPWEALLAAWKTGRAPVTHDVIEGTRLFEPPAPGPLARALGSVRR